MPPTRHRPRTTPPALALALILALAGCGARAPRGPARSPAVGGRGAVASGGVVNVRAFAAIKGDGVTDDYAAMQALVNSYKGHRFYLSRRPGPPVVTGTVPPSYYFSQPIVVPADAPGTVFQGDGLSTVIQCGDRQTGFDFYAQSCGIEDLALVGTEIWSGQNATGWWEGAIPAGWASVTGAPVPGITAANGASDADGVRFRQAQCFARNVRVTCFGRCGINANASLLNVAVGMGLESSSLDKIDATSCRGNGLDILGGDANTNVIANLNANTNQFFGANMSAFLANVNDGGQVAQNHYDSTALHSSSAPAAVVSLARSANVVTLTWLTPQTAPVYVPGTHGVQITSCQDASFIGRWPVLSVASDNLSLTFRCRGPDVTISGNVVTTSGTVTDGKAKVTGLASTSGIAPGMRAFADALPLTAAVQSVDSGTQVTLTTPATASGPFYLAFGPGGSHGAQKGVLTAGSAVVTLIATAGIVAGDAVAVADVMPRWDTVKSVDSGTQVTLDAGVGLVGLTNYGINSTTPRLVFGTISGYINYLAPETTVTLSRSGGVVTATFPGAYVLNGGRNPFRCGLGITLLNCADPTFDGTFAVVTAAGDHLSVTYNQAGADGTTTGYGRMAVPKDLWEAYGLIGGSYGCLVSSCQLVMVGPYAEGGQDSYLGNATLVLAPTWSADPVYEPDVPGGWNQLPLILYPALSGTGTPGTNRPLSVRWPYDLGAVSITRIGKTAPQVHYDYWSSPVLDEDAGSYPVIWTDLTSGGVKQVWHKAAFATGAALREEVDNATGHSTYNSEGAGQLRVNADAGTGTGGAVFGDGTGANSLTLDGKSLRLTPVHDADAQPNSLFLSLDHVDAAGDAKLCRKGAGGAVTVLQLAPVLLLCRGRRGPRGRIRARGRAA